MVGELFTEVFRYLSNVKKDETTDRQRQRAVHVMTTRLRRRGRTET